MTDPHNDAHNPVSSPRGWWSRRANRALVVVAVVYVILGGLALLILPATLLRNWLPNSSVEEQGKLLGAAAQIVLFGLGGIIAVVGVTLSVARHQEELESQDRDRTRLADDRQKELNRRSEWEAARAADVERELRARFVTTVDMLDTAIASKRSAALYALGALADDWEAHGRPDEVQVCIDVLCGYLRAPLDEKDYLAEIAVRQVGYDVIGKHLRDEPRRSWTAYEVDLRNATIRGTLNLRHMMYDKGGRISLTGATVSRGGEVLFARSTFGSGRVQLEKVAVGAEGVVSFDQTTISQGARIQLINATVSHRGQLTFEEMKVTEGGVVDMSDAKISERGRVTFSNTVISPDGLGGAFQADRAQVRDGGRIDVENLSVGAQGRWAMDASVISTAGSVRFRGLPSLLGTVSFEWAQIEKGGEIRFYGNVRNMNESLVAGQICMAWTEVSGSINFGETYVADGGSIDVSNMTVAHGGRVSLDRVSHVSHDDNSWLTEEELSVEPGGAFIRVPSQDNSELRSSGDSSNQSSGQ